MFHHFKQQQSIILMNNLFSSHHSTEFEALKSSNWWAVDSETQKFFKTPLPHRVHAAHVEGMQGCSWLANLLSCFALAGPLLQSVEPQPVMFLFGFGPSVVTRIVDFILMATKVLVFLQSVA